MELVVGDLHTFHAFKCRLCQFIAQMVWQEVGLLFQRVLGRHHQPYLIQCTLAQDSLSQCDMSYVYGIERPPEDARLDHSLFQEVLNDLQRLLLGSIQVVIDYDAVKLRGKGQFVFCFGQTLCYRFSGIRGASFQSTA